DRQTFGEAGAGARGLLDRGQRGRTGRGLRGERGRAAGQGQL
ncbi:MAG: hypothetical protein AVDCRST_MAG22-3428, partial [uncultured Rubrobacteraceae bacterium]